MELFPYFWTAFGLIIGSFLNVCIYRLPRHESIVFPGSHCPHCGKAVRPYDNIPVLSYLVLAGKCRFCRKPISFQYPLVEALSGLSFLACALFWGATAPAFINSLFLAAILVLIFIDYHHQILPDIITIPGIIAGLLVCPFQDQAFYADSLAQRIAELVSWSSADSLTPWIGALLGAVAGGGLLWLVAKLYYLARRRHGMGMGDVKMMAMVGAFLGWRLALLTIFLGSFLGSVAGVLLILFGGRSLTTKLAFGTFLGIASSISLFHGLSLVQWYLTR